MSGPTISRSAANASLELASMEMAARERAKKQVANLLQRPDQLEKVEMIRKRVARRKGSVEAQLKTAVQSQLDGVKTGLNQLHIALKDIREIKQNLDEIDRTYKTISGLGEKLKPIREEHSRHSQLVAAVDNLVHIFTVPETIKKCREYISDGKLLHAHKSISELESCRDDLLYELYRQQSQSPTDKNTVMQYFKDLDQLSDLLSKQLWLVLHRTIISVRMEPTIIVTVLRIIEREERMDAMMMKRYDQMKLPGRPKLWKQKAFEVMKEAVATRIEGSQMEDRTASKMWLVRHLELTRQIVIDDLRVVKMMCEPCFPPHYDIVNRYIGMYHSSIAQHLADIVQQGLEGNEIVSLLTWISEYPSKELMGSPDLRIDVSQFSPLLDQQTISMMHDTYLHNLKTNFKNWMENSLKTDAKDWVRDVQPDADEKGYYNTTLPIILGQMIEQNLEVAATVGASNLVLKLVNMCADEMMSFAQIYRRELMAYKEQHMANRSMPQYFLNYMIANANNCQTFADFAQRMKAKYIPADSKDAVRFEAVLKTFGDLALAVCDWILEEVFTDLDKHVKKLLTTNWLANSNVVDTVCITIEDYCSDCVHLRDAYYDSLLIRAQSRVAREYYKPLFAGKLRFKTYEERCQAAEQITKESEQLSQLFKRLLRKGQQSSPFDPMPALAEFIKLRDTSMMSLEVTGFVNNYPDIKIDQLVNLLFMRGDINRGEAKQLVVDCLGEDYDTKPKNKKTIFFQLGGGGAS